MKRQLTMAVMGCFYCNQLILFSSNISTIIVGAIWSTTMRFFSSLQMIRYVRKSACMCLKSGSTSGRDTWSGKWVTLSCCEHNWAFKRLNSWCQEIKLKKKESWKFVGGRELHLPFLYDVPTLSSLNIYWTHTIQFQNFLSLSLHQSSLVTKLPFIKKNFNELVNYYYFFYGLKGVGTWGWQLNSAQLVLGIFSSWNKAPAFVVFFFFPPPLKMCRFYMLVKENSRVVQLGSFSRGTAGSVAGYSCNVLIPIDRNEIEHVLTGAAAALRRHWKSS